MDANTEKPRGAIRAIRTAVASVAALALAATGCGGDEGDGGGSVGSGNDRNLVVCVGDSLTQGGYNEGLPYPTRLGAMSGKTVLNCGVGGRRSSYGATVIDSILERRPGHVCILFGTNDCAEGIPESTTVSNLRRMVRACKANGTRAIVATPPPMSHGFAVFNDRVASLAAAIRAMAGEEGVPCIDLHAAFGDGTGYIRADGLHLTDAGGELVAKKFNSKL